MLCMSAAVPGSGCCPFTPHSVRTPLEERAGLSPAFVSQPRSSQVLRGTGEQHLAPASFWTCHPELGWPTRPHAHCRHCWAQTLALRDTLPGSAGGRCCHCPHRGMLAPCPSGVHRLGSWAHCKCVCFAFDYSDGKPQDQGERSRNGEDLSASWGTSSSRPGALLGCSCVTSGSRSRWPLCSDFPFLLVLVTVLLQSAPCPQGPPVV